MSTPAQSPASTLESRLAFIDAIELPERAPRRFVTEPPPPDFSQDGFVSAGSLASFDDAVSDDRKADVLHSELLAQLAADKAYDAQTQPMEWYGKYTEVLKNIGWVIQAQDWRPYHSSSASFDIDAAVLDILRAVALGDGLAIIQATFEALRNTGQDSSQVEMFDHKSTKGGNANFRAFPCYMAEMGIAVSFSGYQITTTETITHFLWWTFRSSDTEVQAAASTYVLDEQVYEPLRKAILDKLGLNANEFINGLEI